MPHGLFQLLEQPIDRFELFLDFQRLRNGHGRAAGERVFAGQFIDLVFFAQSSHQLHELPRKARAIVAGLIPQPLEIANLLVSNVLHEAPF